MGPLVTPRGSWSAMPSAPWQPECPSNSMHSAPALEDWVDAERAPQTFMLSAVHHILMDSSNQRYLPAICCSDAGCTLPRRRQTPGAAPPCTPPTTRLTPPRAAPSSNRKPGAARPPATRRACLSVTGSTPSGGQPEPVLTSLAWQLHRTSLYLKICSASLAEIIACICMLP